jgi:putative nucleotidyltransferase with HDIG domain
MSKLNDKLRRWPYFTRRQQRTSKASKPRLEQTGTTAGRLLLAAVSIALLTYFSPVQRPYSVTKLEVGDVAPERINTPFEFHIRKSDDELKREQREAEQTVPTVLRPDTLVKERELAQLDSVLNVLIRNVGMQMPDSLKQRRLQKILPDVIPSLSETSLQNLIVSLSSASPDSARLFQEACLQLVADIYSIGVISDKSGPQTSITDRVRIGEEEKHLDDLHEESSLKRGGLIPIIDGYAPIVERGSAEAVDKLLSLFITPNLTVDSVETMHLRAGARGSVAAITRRYLRDEMIIDKNTKVEQFHVDALESLVEKYTRLELQDSTTRWLQSVAAAVIAAVFVLTFGFYLSTQEPEIYRDLGRLVLLAIITLGTAAIASYIHANEIDTFYVPTPLAALLMTILLSPQVGLVVSFLLALFIGSLFGDFYVALICALTSAVAVYSVRRVRHRNQFYRAMILLPASYALLVAAADLMRFVQVEEIYEHILPGIFTGLAAPIVIQGLLPIFESVFHITTDITLLELSDLNRPLLRELAIRAPGTYTHSLIMANLSEAAGEAVGANPLLARVGCYYHDIGKMLKPEYFGENQGLRGGRNPHDHLTPSMSVLIIDSHVKDGIELGEENGLPRAIIDLIPQHHGTTVIEVFYNRAVELGVENVRKADFSYDGPKPQTREAGILMLADSVESAARTVSERTPDRVRQLVRNIVQQKFTTGELDECPLTLRDLHKIEDSFIPVLMGTLHGRLEYPWQKKEERRARRDA